jgi:Niemann-Pick C1 protein
MRSTVTARTWPALATICLAGLAAVTSAASNLTTKHEAGRCAIRGDCGSARFFGPQLPCPDNGLAEDPEAAVRDQLVQICGDEWAETKICCRKEQVSFETSH